MGKTEETKEQGREVGGDSGCAVSGTVGGGHLSLWALEFWRLERSQWHYWHLREPNTWTTPLTSVHVLIGALFQQAEGGHDIGMMVFP